jgi:hypothetical protein
MKLSTHSVRKSCVEVFFHWMKETNTRLQRSIVLWLSTLALASSGCATPLTVAGESPLGVSPRTLESVVLLLNPGVFKGLQTFGKLHIEHLGC